MEAPIHGQNRRPQRAVALLAVLAGVCAAAQAVEVEVGNLDRWISLNYSGIEANEVSLDGGRLAIGVNGSASPLVYRFDEPVDATGLTVKAEWAGALTIPDGAVQGEPNADDFVLKVGIVEAGDRTLSWLERRFAAEWIRELYALAPEGSGIERILFLSTTRSKAQVGSARRHPLSDLLHERRVTYLEQPGTFSMTHRFDKPVRALGLWISADGDDTGSAFEVRIDEIRLSVD